MKKSILFGAFVSLSCPSMERESNNLVIDVRKPLTEKISSLQSLKLESVEFCILEKSIKTDLEKLPLGDYRLHKKLYLAQREIAVTNEFRLLQKASPKQSRNSEERIINKHPTKDLQIKSRLCNCSVL